MMLIFPFILIALVTLVVLANYKYATAKSLPFLKNAILLLIVATPSYILFGDPNYGARHKIPSQTASSQGERFTSYEDLLAVQSQDVQAWQDVAVMLRLQGDYQKAAQAFGQAGDFAIAPREQAGFYEAAGLMQIESSQGVVDREAYLMFTKAVASNPDTVDAQFYLGVSNQTTGQNEIALIHYRTFLEIADPRHPLIRDARSRIETLSKTRLAPRQTNPLPELSQSVIDDFEALPESQRAEFIQEMTLRRLNQLDNDGGTAEEWNALARMFDIAGNAEKANYARQKAERPSP